jgi:tetratricopeptide (TPR) repeat protein
MTAVLAACSSTIGPVTIRESANVDAEPENNTQNINSNKDDGISVALVKPVNPDALTSRVPIVEMLVQQANLQYKANNYNKTINIAERGLRIDRKEPRFYLALTKAYKSLNNAQQAIYFARQGLRYAKQNSPVFFELKRMSMN